MQTDYKVELDVFEGPLDLLLYLIKQEEVDIYHIPIERITTQYMEYLGLMRMLDLNIAGEFIVMAATLMMIKSRMLLPVEERPELEAEEEDPRWELVRQLVEYKKFKDAAAVLQTCEVRQENVFGLGAEHLNLAPEDAGLPMQDVTLFDLITAFREALKRAAPEEIGEIQSERFSVSDKIDAILTTLRRDRSISFRALFAPAAPRYEIICTFLALLELLRLRQVCALQEGPFAEIVIHRGEESPEWSATPAGALP